MKNKGSELFCPWPSPDETWKRTCLPPTHTHLLRHKHTNTQTNTNLKTRNWQRCLDEKHGETSMQKEHVAFRFPFTCILINTLQIVTSTHELGVNKMGVRRTWHDHPGGCRPPPETKKPPAI
jgi:hypothetical protein